MSILIKPYILSVWEDVWDSSAGKFVEKRVGIIGTNEMIYQGRALEPTLTRNVNGTKKLSFKMYKYFIDNMTGEKTYNKFSDWLVSERKVKLFYDNKWYDFIVKDVAENSADYLFTYSLEDALVQELSKNGFGVTLDAQRMNNMGDVDYLANEVLKETDWKVDSETFVEKVDEALVYVQLPTNNESTNESIKNWWKNTTIHKLTDNKEDFLREGLEDNQVTDKSSFYGKTILAFYSSCRNKPHRFQFIYLADYSKANVSVDKNRKILNKNCQYYIEFEPTEYTEEDTNYGFILPEGFTIIDTIYSDDKDSPFDSIISTWYRGGRYGFAQSAVYVPLLDRYCQIYSGPEYTLSNNESLTDYYGYEEKEYNTPVFTTNLVSNTEFESTSGWIGTYSEKGTSNDRATIQNVYGKFVGPDGQKEFVNVTQVLTGEKNTGETLEVFLAGCSPYMKVELKSKESLVINSGPYDNRTLIGKMPKDSKWAFRAECVNEQGDTVTKLAFDFGNYVYDNGAYSIDNPIIINPDTKEEVEQEIIFSALPDNSGYKIYEVEENTYINENSFVKNSKLKIAITGDAGVYYIKTLEFFAARFTKNADGEDVLITFDQQGDNAESGVITSRYRYFKPSALDGVVDVKDLHYDCETDTLSYDMYKPVYNSKGQKIRAVSAKESNYFNILQSIAETFECWLELEIKRDDFGAIEEKFVKFKNYAGGDNYAAFRYGVNLKDIQRTHTSKNIVTKLMVKQNSNQHGKDGFCTIARAGANPSADTSIYDFSYFQNMGLMNATDYINTVYKIGDTSGSDNIQGYFPRIAAINRDLINETELATNLKTELLELEADLEIQKTKLSAANSGLEESADSFRTLTGVSPTELVGGEVPIKAIELDAENKFGKTAESELQTHIAYVADADFSIDVSSSVKDKIITITATAADSTKGFTSGGTIYITAYPRVTTSGGVKINKKLYVNLQKEEGEKEVSQTLSVATDISSSQVQNYLNQYSTYLQQKEEASRQVPDLESQVNTKKDDYTDLETKINALKEQKALLNKLFFTKYSRFIQEGTWISEEHYDDEKYYNDALSVMYNSCYPQVAYTINTNEVSQLPGYELFNFEVGEKTYAEDGDFFGYDKNGHPKREEVIITEKTENLDDPSKNTNKVQNFKNQFQDLFQKITATVQQAQYNTGAYEKGVAEANAIAENSKTFLRNTLDGMAVNLSNPKLESISSDNSSVLMVVDGKILIGARNENNEMEWKTGLSSAGIAAELLTAGRIQTNKIQIFGGDSETFRWDEHGLTAFDCSVYNNIVSGVNTNKFVRFDKYGIYGIDGRKEGTSWIPGQINGKTAEQEIDESATFALTWQGLKVTGNNGTVARIGKQNEHIVYITDGSGNPIFSVNNNGSSKIAGWEIRPEQLVKQINKPDGEDTTGIDWQDGKKHLIFGMQVKAGEKIGSANAIAIGQIADENKWGDAAFRVTHDGQLYATGAEIQGKITAESGGRIAQWNITNNGIKSEHTDINNRIFETIFSCPTYLDDGDGKNLPAGINGDASDVLVVKYKDSDGKYQYPFYIRSSGYVKCDNLHATGGQIAGWKIDGKKDDWMTSFTNYTLQAESDAKDSDYKFISRLDAMGGFKWAYTKKAKDGNPETDVRKLEFQQSAFPLLQLRGDIGSTSIREGWIRLSRSGARNIDIIVDIQGGNTRLIAQKGQDAVVLASWSNSTTTTYTYNVVSGSANNWVLENPSKVTYNGAADIKYTDERGNNRKTKEEIEVVQNSTSIHISGIWYQGNKITEVQFKA